MLKSYPAIYQRGQIHWLDQVPQQANAMLLEEYKERLAPEQVVLLFRLMGRWQLTDSAMTSPYDYPES